MSNTFFLMVSITGIAYCFVNIAYVAFYSGAPDNFRNILLISIAWLLMHIVHLVARVEIRERTTTKKADTANEVEEYTEQEGKPVKRKAIPLYMRNAILRRDNYTCTWCGKRGNTSKDWNGETHQIDHIVPCNRGGDTIMSNLATSCRLCNNTRQDKMPIEFIRYMKRKA